MTKYRVIRGMLLVSAPLLLAAAASFHLELTTSYPEADQSLDNSPTEIWLQFNEPPDMEQTSFSVRGADGAVELGDVIVGDKPEVVKAVVASPMAAGEYTLSWVAAPADDHAVRGRFGFTVMGSR